MANRRDHKSGYYTSETHRAKKRGRFSVGRPMLRIFDLLMIVITVADTLALLLSLLSSRVNPNTTTLFAFLGLVFPILYVIEIVCALYWALRWRKWFVVSLTALIFGFSTATLYYRMHLTKSYSQDNLVTNELSVMSFNVMGMDRQFDSKQGSCAEQIAEMINNSAVNVVCLQEYVKNEQTDELFTESLGNMRYKAFRNMDHTAGERNGWGLAIYSLYPIVKYGICDVDSVYIRSLWADLKINRDTVRIINNHFQTTSINQDDRLHTLTTDILTDERRKERISNLIDKLSVNYRLRATQADTLANFISRSPHPVIICGDFNDTPSSYTYRTVRKGMTDAYIEHGRGGDGTYKGFFNMFRIDYIFTSKELDVNGYSQSDVVLSDHSPIMANIKLKPKD